MHNLFALKQPCKDCPFRTDNGFILGNERVEEITDSLLRGESFHCHKTLEYDDDGEGCSTDNSMHCAGAMIMLEHMEKPNQIMRIAERLGLYDCHKLKMDSPVFHSTRHMQNQYRVRNQGKER